MKDKDVIEGNIPLAVQIVDLVQDMLEADARRSYMEERIVRLLSNVQKFDREKWQDEYYKFCEKMSDPSYKWGAYASCVFDWLEQEKLK